MNFIYQKSIIIHAPAKKVWEILTRPKRMQQWISDDPMTVTVKWETGGQLTYEGLHKGEPYLAKGLVREFVPNELLSYTFWNSITGTPDLPEYYSFIEIYLTASEKGVLLHFTQANFQTEVEFKHVEFYWNVTLGIIKKMAEGHS
jgi:uncharacterized protein YndB with AHSA1/START domain